MAEVFGWFLLERPNSWKRVWAAAHRFRPSLHVPSSLSFSFSFRIVRHCSGDISAATMAARVEGRGWLAVVSWLWHAAYLAKEEPETLRSIRGLERGLVSYSCSDTLSPDDNREFDFKAITCNYYHVASGSFIWNVYYYLEFSSVKENDFFPRDS